MSEFRDALQTALALLLRLDGDLTAIVGLSLLVSLSAVFLAALAGLPVGAAVALYRFPGALEHSWLRRPAGKVEA